MNRFILDGRYEDLLGFYGISVDFNSITFRNQDLEKPFTSYDEAMWGYLEPELSRRLAQLDVEYHGYSK